MSSWVKQADIMGDDTFLLTQQDLLLLDGVTDKHIQPQMLCSWYIWFSEESPNQWWML